MTTTSTTSLIDLSWIPLRRLDGTVTHVGLREVFLGADRFTQIMACLLYTSDAADE